MSGSKKRKKRQKSPGIGLDSDRGLDSGRAEQRGSDGRGRELAERAIKDADPELASELEKLSPEEALVFLELVEKALKKRRIMLAGYILTLIIMVVGMLAAFYIYAQREPGQFLVWVFFVPFTLVGSVLFFFGRWARNV